MSGPEPNGGSSQAWQTLHWPTEPNRPAEEPAHDNANDGLRAGSTRQDTEYRGESSQRVDYQMRLLVLEQAKNAIRATVQKKQLTTEPGEPSSSMALVAAKRPRGTVDEIPASSSRSFPSTGERPQAPVDLINSVDQQMEATAGIKRFKFTHKAPESQESTVRPARDQRQEADQTSHISLIDAAPDGSFFTPPANPVVDQVPTVEKSNSSSPRYINLCRVVCTEKSPSCHLRLYKDKTTAINSMGHISGNTPVSNSFKLSELLKDVVFIVYQEILCTKGFPLSEPPFTTKDKVVTRPLGLVIGAVSAELRSVMQSLSKFSPKGNSSREVDYADLDGKRLSTFIMDLCVPMSSRSWEYTGYFLNHHWKEIHEKAAATQENCHINILSEWLFAHPWPWVSYDDCNKLFSQGLVSQNTLGWLFSPNSVVVSREGPREQAYVLKEVPRPGIPFKKSQLILSCWSWGFDGHELFRKDKILHVDISTTSPVQITQLDVYPLQYASSYTRGVILNTGTKFWNLVTPSLVSYKRPDHNGSPQTQESRCLIDYQTFKMFHPDSKEFNESKDPRAAYDLWPDRIPLGAPLQEDNIMLLPPNILALVLKEKKWLHLPVDHIHPPKWNKAAFEQLVLPKGVKNLIRSLVMAQKSNFKRNSAECTPQNLCDGIDRGKCEGVTMLLHGAPGTGKTLTAESVSELAEMPLYSVTCAELKTNPEADDYLKFAFHLVKRWNFILLLDEADMFLEQGSPSDLRRNSLVAVLLNKLRSPGGIVILTSNRVTRFDDAVMARIQQPLHFEPLAAVSRREIWHNFLDMMRADGQKIDYSGIVAKLDQLSAYELNGRQIRDGLKTAQQLASFDDETLNWDRLKDILEVTNNFNQYLKDVHGRTDE